MKQNKLATYLILMVFVLTAACSIHPKPSGPRGAIALASHDLTVMVEATTTAYASGLISKERAHNLLEEYKKVKVYLMTAKQSISDGTPSETDKWISMAVALLTQLAMEEEK